MFEFNEGSSRRLVLLSKWMFGVVEFDVWVEQFAIGLRLIRRLVYGATGFKPDMTRERASVKPSPSSTSNSVEVDLFSERAIEQGPA